MPRKAMKCIVEVDLHVTTCPGTFLRDYEYVYLHMEMLGLEARTKSVPPTFPLFFHERLKFERTFYDCTDPALVAAVLKGEDLIIELRQHTDYISDGKVISHCSSNTHDFLYPAIPPYYGSGREILLYKTAKFKPIRVTGEPVKLEFSTKTVIKEVPDFETSGALDKSSRTIASPIKSTKHKQLADSRVPKPPGRPKTSGAGDGGLRRSKSKSSSTPDLTLVGDSKNEFLVRRKDDQLISNRDFNSFTRPKPRRSVSPSRSMRRSVSPSRPRTFNGNTTVESIPATVYRSSSPARHYRSVTEPTYLSSTTPRNLTTRLDDLDLSLASTKRRVHTVTPNMNHALRSSQRIQRRVDELVRRRDFNYVDSDAESDYSLDLLRESLRDERNALNDAIKEADREAFYRSLNRTR
eukprot:TCONS_00000143-protein